MGDIRLLTRTTYPMCLLFKFFYNREYLNVRWFPSNIPDRKRTKLNGNVHPWWWSLYSYGN